MASKKIAQAPVVNEMVAGQIPNPVRPKPLNTTSDGNVKRYVVNVSMEETNGEFILWGDDPGEAVEKVIKALHGAKIFHISISSGM